MSSKNFLILFACLLATFETLLAADAASTSKASPKASEISAPSKVEQLFSQRKYKEVVELLSPQIEKLSRKDTILLGNSYAGLSNHPAALKTFISLSGRNPKDFEVETLIGRQHFLMGKDSEALSQFRKALEFNESYYPAFRLLVELYQKKGNKYELRLLYQDMVEKFGKKPEFINKICELAAAEGLYDLALENCRLGVQMNSRESSNYVNLGLTLKQKGETEQANQYLKQAADSFPKSLLAQMTFGLFLAEQKNYVLAYQYFKNATIADPKSAEAFSNLGLNAVEIQKYEEAFVAFQNACKLKSNSVMALRRAASSLRTYNVSAWLSKFENLSENCR